MTSTAVLLAALMGVLIVYAGVSAIVKELNHIARALLLIEKQQELTRETQHQDANAIVGAIEGWRRDVGP